jgi:hypothetical protein
MKQKSVEEKRLWKYEGIWRCFSMARDNGRSFEVESANFRGFNNDIVPRNTVGVKFVQIVREARNEVVVNRITSKFDSDDCATLHRSFYEMRKLICKPHVTVCKRE